jgi:thiosulfate/3-mercaptopyruvate sulfurtransferase
VTRSIDPIVSTDWLEARLPGGELTIVDIRFEEEYEAGHIPGAVSAPFVAVSAWADCTDELLLELPSDAELFKNIGDLGISADSKVVIVGRLEKAGGPPYPLSDAARVAATLIYAGVTDVGILSGAHPKWEAEGRPLTTEVPDITPVVYTNAVDSRSWVSTDYVERSIGKAVLVDARDADQYFGASIDPFADMRGHIPTARNLPIVWVWEKDGTYRDTEFIRAIASGVLGEDKEREIITYCGVGGYAATWWFLLTQLLGYRDVKIYDGSMEAWVKEHDLVRYTWCS